MDFPFYAPYTPDLSSSVSYAESWAHPHRWMWLTFKVLADTCSARASYMKILMLGWEYPPHIAGGLGTACQGLTGALSDRGVAIRFVVPHLYGDEQASHMVLSAPTESGNLFESKANAPHSDQPTSPDEEKSATVGTTRIPAFLSPYWSPTRFKEALSAFAERFNHSSSEECLVEPALLEPCVNETDTSKMFAVQLDSGIARSQQSSTPQLYPVGSSIFSEVERFTSNTIATCSRQTFDIIHAHDWMTFSAGVALSQLTGKPLIVHVHSLEQDRSGLFVDKDVEKIERLGLETAVRVIAVSHYTRRMIERFHGIPSSKIRVIHNGVYPRQAVQDYQIRKTWPRKVVLFLGRVTFQKGPDYFVEVAARVIPQVPGVLFVLAGNGDMLPAVKKQVEELGLNEYFMFPGFVSGEELEEIFSVADLYVMPSISEPFGITALEAISFDTPVIISRQSGVSEVLEHALKVDFWDLDRMANLIVSVLLNPELREELVQMVKEEVRHLHWDAAAAKTIEVYEELLTENLTSA